MSKKVWVNLLFSFILLSVLTLAELTINVDKETGPTPLSVNFNVTSEKELLSYAWDFNGDGQTDSQSSAASFLYEKPGDYEVQLTVITKENETLTLTKKISVKASLSLSAVANPSSGFAPLLVQFTSIAAGQEPLTYAWDFQSDGTSDSTSQNPATTFEQAGDYNATLTVTDATGNNASQILPIKVQAFDSRLNLTSYFPTTLKKRENQLTLIVQNSGEKTLKDITAKIIGQGFQHLSSSSIDALKPGDQDSLTLKLDILNSSASTATVKILDKNFPLAFTIASEIQYNQQELEAQLALLRQKLQEQESIYTEKKAAGFLVAEIFESIKSLKKQLQDAQQQLLTNRLADAKVNLDLASTSLEDITGSLSEAKKQKVTFLMWLKDNALAITAIIAALGTLSGILVKLMFHAKKAGVQALKVGESMKQKITQKKSPSEKILPETPSSPTTKPEEKISGEPPAPEKKEETPRHRDWV